MLHKGKDNDVGRFVPVQESALLAEAIDAVEVGIMLAEADGFIIFANARARELLDRGEGLRADGGWITAASAETTRRLRALIGRRAAEADGARPRAATIMLECGPNRSSLVAHVTPLASRGWASYRSHAAVIAIIDPSAHALPGIDAFAAHHGLTRCEARVLREIIGGRGLVAASTRLRISEATARTHLRNIFEKTGTSRQTELLRMFFGAAIPMTVGVLSIAN